MKARGLKVGQSLHEPDMAKVCKRLEMKARNKGVRLLLPDDFVYSEGYDNNVLTGYVKYADCYPSGMLPVSMMGLDIADQSLETIVSCYKSARTLFWNGPVGAAELDKFAWGSKCVATLLASMGKLNRTTIVGGKDTLDVLEKVGMRDQISHCSSGGASFMDIMERKILPGLTCLLPAADMRVPPPADDVPLFDVDAELEPLDAMARETGTTDMYE
uniref:Phosphoglycerate kinase n=1 Tax=Lotharella oceanica TaxID=641309 RepID=A0A7S2TPT0_9EUKA